MDVSTPKTIDYTTWMYQHQRQFNIQHGCINTKDNSIYNIDVSTPKTIEYTTWMYQHQRQIETIQKKIFYKKKTEKR